MHCPVSLSVEQKPQIIAVLFTSASHLGVTSVSFFFISANFIAHTTQLPTMFFSFLTLTCIFLGVTFLWGYSARPAETDASFEKRGRLFCEPEAKRIDNFLFPGGDLALEEGEEVDCKELRNPPVLKGK